MPSKYIKKILDARVYPVAVETPLDPAPLLDERLGNRIFLKREDLQPVFSFKIRGAYNKIASLTADERARGVIAASAGNHAQGVALSCQRLGVSAILVMPATTPEIKVDAVRRMKAEAVLHGDTYDEAHAHARALAQSRGMVFVHPYDDPEVIAGQGTIGMEILRQHKDGLHAVFVPVGGGGLIAGVGTYLKYLHPEIRIIGVEPEGSAALHQSLAAGRRICLDRVDLFADGVAVKQIGEEPFRLARECVDRVVRVNVDEICAAIKDIFDDTRTIAEPAGALGVAGLKRYVQEEGIRSASMVALVSGANVNFNRLRHISERAELGEEREALFALNLPERPGALKAFCRVLGPVPITAFSYRHTDPDQAYVFLGVGLAGKVERDATLHTLRGHGYLLKDLTDSELAKQHVRHMVGGHVKHDINELLYRFEFPERQGALMAFLARMADTWNISLFHYRNGGTTYGQVLVGFQIPQKERAAFRRFLADVGYPFAEETDNQAYHLFLGNPSRTDFA